MSTFKAVGMIPTRLESTRLPRKALLSVEGLPLIIHTLKRAQMAKSLWSVYVCTDSEEIADVVRHFGGQVLMTKSSHHNGTTRIAEGADILARRGERYDLYVDIQGDEPLIDPSCINQVVDLHQQRADEWEILLPTIPLAKPNNEHIVKVVKSGDRVLYLTRAVAPHPFRGNGSFHKHLSIISFTLKALNKFTALPVSTLESLEGIELLRALEHGMVIGTTSLDADSFSVDVLDDYHRACEQIKNDPWTCKYINITQRELYGIENPA